ITASPALTRAMVSHSREAQACRRTFSRAKNSEGVSATTGSGVFVGSGVGVAVKIGVLDGVCVYVATLIVWTMCSVSSSMAFVAPISAACVSAASGDGVSVAVGVALGMGDSVAVGMSVGVSLGRGASVGKMACV